MINGSPHSQWFRVQEGEPGEWRVVANTAMPSPQDIAVPGQEEVLKCPDYLVGERSIVVLCRPRALR